LYFEISGSIEAKFQQLRSLTKDREVELLASNFVKSFTFLHTSLNKKWEILAEGL
jgi:hypothetical protein